MPIYDYACQVCGHQIEVIHGVHDAGPSVCPVCGGPMRKLLSTPAIVFKGSGWAKKDRGTRRAPAKAGAGADKEGTSTDGQAASTDSRKTDSGKTDSKPPKSGATSESKGARGNSDTAD